MRLVTWNVNSLRVRMPRLLEFLAQHSPDIALLQETRCDPEGFPHAELADVGYHAVDHSGGRWAGVAILAREGLELTDSLIGLPGEPAEVEARWVEASVSGIRFVSVYVPNGRAIGTEFFDGKLEFLQAAAARTAALRETGVPLVVAGDMNVAPTDLDVYDPVAFVGDTHVTPEERSGLERVLDAGVLDAYRHVHPDEPGFTWWDYRAGHFHKGMGMRIDFALVSPDLAERVTECGIDRNYRKGPKPSDHAPLLVELS